MRTTRQYRTFFWPAVLILIGIVALLVNTGRLPVERLYLLFDLWPLILIVVGVEIIIRRSVRGAASEVAAILVVVLAIAGALAYVAVGPASAGSSTLDASNTTGDLHQASLEVDAGGATITIGTATSGDQLYHAHIQYSGQKPSVTLDRASGALKVDQSDTGFNFLEGRRFVLDLQLNPNVAWSYTENTGAATDTLDLRAAKLDSMTLNTGASRDDIKLGQPSGSVSITINGGALTLHLHRPSGTEASIGVSGGAISLDADGHQNRAIGTLSYQTPGFGGAKDSYQVTVNGGACSVTLDTT